MPFKPREYLRLNPEGLLRSKTADGFRATLTAERVALTCRVGGGVSPVGWGALPFLVVGRPLGQLRNRAKPHATTCASLSNHVHGMLRPDFDPMSTPERHQRTFMKFMWPSGCPSCLVRLETEASVRPCRPDCKQSPQQHELCSTLIRTSKNIARMFPRCDTLRRHSNSTSAGLVPNVLHDGRPISEGLLCNDLPIMLSQHLPNPTPDFKIMI